MQNPHHRNGGDISADRFHLTGRNPAILAALITLYGDIIWLGGAETGDRGDRYSHKPATIERTPDPMNATNTLVNLIDGLRTRAGMPKISPIDADAAPGTQRRRIAAHNVLLDVATPFKDRICGQDTNGRPCILKDGHKPSEYDDTTRHLNAEARERAIRYLVHSEPDPAKRA